MSAPHVLHCDGAARGNPGPAAIGAVLFAPGKLEPVAVVCCAAANGSATASAAAIKVMRNPIRARLRA